MIPIKFNLESGIKMFSIPFEFDVESLPIDVQMEQWFLMVRAPPKVESIYFQGTRALTRFRTRKFWSINLSKNTFAFTAYLKSGGLETKDNHVRERSRKKVKNHCNGIYWIAEWLGSESKTLLQLCKECLLRFQNVLEIDLGVWKFLSLETIHF